MPDNNAEQTAQAAHDTVMTGFSYVFGAADVADAATAPAAEAPVPLPPRHQRILLRLAVPLAALAQEQKSGTVYIAPLDVIIEKSPLRVRRPDLFYLSHTRMKPEEEPEGALDIGPDLVIDVLNPDQSRRSFAPVLEDYTTIGVCEVWLVSPQSETVEVLRATADGFETAALYGPGTAAASEVLPGYRVAVDDIFA